MPTTTAELSQKLDIFIDRHLEGLDRRAKVAGLREYVHALGLAGQDKSMMALAQKSCPENVEGCRQRMQRALAQGKAAPSMVFERIQRTIHNAQKSKIKAFCIDDTGIAKQGDLSVGVQRQYSGTLGKVGNCQVLVTLHAISNERSFCVGGQLYLPEVWATDEDRRTLAQIPTDIIFKTKCELALELVEKALENGMPKLPILADAAYGDNRAFRDRLVELGLDFGVGVSSKTVVWRPGVHPEKPKQDKHKRGRPGTIPIDPKGSQPIELSDLAKELDEQNAFKAIPWRKGTKGDLAGRFVCIRVRSAERRTKVPSDEIWLVIEKTKQPKRPYKYYFCSLPKDVSHRRIINLLKMRWRIEMDYRDMKQHLGLDQYEGRSWGGFHRHFAMVALMHTFIALHRERFSPLSSEQMELESVL